MQFKCDIQMMREREQMLQKKLASVVVESSGTGKDPARDGGTTNYDGGMQE
jgi:hypothetical protein